MMITLKRPQLASSEIPDIDTQVQWPKFIQPKYDGICCLAIDGVAYSRTLKPIPNQNVQKWFKDLNLHGWHGELLLPDLTEDYNLVQSAIMSADGTDNFRYVVYDCWNSDELYHQRLADMVHDLYDKTLDSFDRLILCQTHCVRSADECKNLLNSFLMMGHEGAVLRDPQARYKQGRCTLKSQSLMKLKLFEDDEAIITGVIQKFLNFNDPELDERGYTKRSTNKDGLVPIDTLGALMVSWRGVDFKIGSGFTEAQRKELWNSRETLMGKPATFKYQGVSADGIPRFPIYKGLRLE